MNSEKHPAGAAFEVLIVSSLDDGTLTLGQPRGGFDWQMIVVYRGKHCPVCTSYLKELNTFLPDLNALGVDVVAVSADPRERAEAQMAQVLPDFSIGYDLSISQMHALGLYVSDPRSPEENDRSFAEPGLFIVNADGKLQLVDISNAPFMRPELAKLVGGIRFIRNPDNNYPIRGMAQAS